MYDCCIPYSWMKIIFETFKNLAKFQKALKLQLHFQKYNLQNVSWRKFSKSFSYSKISSDIIAGVVIFGGID